MKTTTQLFIFLLLFGTFSLQAQVYNNPGGTVNTCSGTFLDTGGDTANYGDNELITTTFCSDNGESVMFNFTSFSLEDGYDYLQVFDGLDATSSPLHTNTSGWTGTSSPVALSSTGTCLTFVFDSDGSVGASGWEAIITCRPPIDPSANINNPGGTINSCEGTFFDSGGLGNYVSNENVITTICPDVAGDCITVDFISFETEANYDELEIFDGLTAGSGSLGIFDGTNSPGTVTATGASGCLTFQFISDGSVTDSGWEAAISCNACGVLICTGNTATCTTSIPDACIDACDLGILAVPTGCPTGGSIANSFCINNIGATAESPYSALTACEDGTDMANPASDVWYSFVAVTNRTTVNINGLNNPSLGVYEGDACNSLLPKACDNGLGALSLTVVTNIGTTYFLQISGGDETDVGDFELEVITTWSCVECLSSSSLSSIPAANNGQYNPGETVEFCYTINSWNGVSVNWLHSVVPSLGAGWDASSLTPTTFPVSCDASGNWDWYDAITGTNTTSGNPGTVGPGYAFDNNAGGPLDGNPGNNYGDAGSIADCPTGVTWTFCWAVTALDCVSNGEGNDLSMSIETYGDGETGSYNTVGCTSDPVFTILTTAAECCTTSAVPQNISHQLQEPARCVINWDFIPGALRYDVIYRVKGTQAWTRVGALHNTKTLRYLAPNTTYQYRVRASCDGTWDFANASERREFNTASIPQSQARTTIPSLDVLTVYPNPARESIQVNYTIEESSDTHLMIMDMTGRLILEKGLGEIEGSNSEIIDISTMNAGYYVLIIQSGKNKLTKKFVKI